MTHTQAANPNPVQKSLLPMLQTWTRFISWTVLLSALLAVLFALAMDGCSVVQTHTRAGLQETGGITQQRSATAR